MKKEIRYVELKTGYNDNGPAWIGLVGSSATGRTLYFQDKAFQRVRGCAGNYIDIETGEEYWISGVKRTGSNRHWAGNGKIQLDRNLENEYLRITNQSKIDQGKITLVDIPKEYPVERLNEKLNR